MLAPLLGLVDDAVKPLAGLFGKLFSSRKPDYVGQFGGKFGGSEFFRDARAGHAQAVAQMEKEHYGHAWNVPFFQGSVEREIRSNSTRGRIASRIKKASPAYISGHSRAAHVASPTKFMKGALTGDIMAGYDKAADNIWGKSARTGLKFGIPLAIMGMATAPKGEMVKRGAEGLSMLAGQAFGGAVGGFALGPLGEIAGQVIGGMVGEKVGAVVGPLEELARQAHTLNFGGEYKDTEAAYTMRQRAVQEMSTSSLNARRYLGSEAALMHQ